MNEKNLIPGAHKLTVEEQSKGGKASGVSRGFRSAVKKRLKDDPLLFDAIISKLIEMSLDGDLKAIDLLLELSGESPRQMELALKKREMKLREAAAKSGGNALAKLDDVLDKIREEL